MAKALPSVLTHVAGRVWQRTRDHGLESGRWCAQAHLTNAWIRWQNRVRPSKRRACPCCGWEGHAFRALDVGRGIDYEVECPGCLRHDRHRFLKLLLERNPPPFLRGPARIAYFSPEQNFASIVRFEHGQRVVYFDLLPEQVSFVSPGVSTDITQMGVGEGQFDGVVCLHVLEHIPDDRAGIAELRRILKPGGVAVIMVPFSRFEKTIEFGAPNLELFGHMRDYSRFDFPERLRGFDVVPYVPAEYLSDEERARFAIRPHETVFYCTRPGE